MEYSLLSVQLFCNHFLSLVISLELHQAICVLRLHHIERYHESHYRSFPGPGCGQRLRARKIFRRFIESHSEWERDSVLIEFDQKSHTSLIE